MSPQPFRTFHYHACAHAFSGKFSRPFEHQIDALAGSVLPIIGGHGQARAENFQFREFLSFRKGYTHVSGAEQTEPDGVLSHNTLVTSTVEGLNLLDVLTADRIVARLYSKHREGDAEGKFNMIGSRFEGLRIADCDVKVELDLELVARIPTYQKALEEFDKKADFYKIASNLFKDRDDKPLERPKPCGAILCSCVKEVEGIKKIQANCPGVTRVGHHGLHVEGFGTIFLGEVVITHGQRTLTMIRFEIGSAVSGKGTVVQADSNGQQWPPSG
jgi:hypothetical protein